MLMLRETTDSLFCDHELFCENHIPSVIFGREAQFENLKFCISAAVSGAKPMNAWLYGKPGTGKTVTCKFLLKKLQRESAVRSIYVNCWENPTFFSVLDKMVREFRVMGAEKLHSSFKLERLQRHLQGKPLIVFLDEIDQPPNKERENILYNLCNMHNTGIVAICNDRHVLYGLDDRIKSRLNARWIEFPPYRRHELVSILEQRAGYGLRSGAYSRAVLSQVVNLAQDDARVAIQTLKNAVYIAEREIAKDISRVHIEQGYMTAKHMKKTYLLHKLTQHHRLLLELVRGNGEILSGKLWPLYVKNCKKLGLAPIAQRTYSEYMNKLSSFGLIESERAPVKGKVRRFRVVL